MKSGYDSHNKLLYLPAAPTEHKAKHYKVFRGRASVHSNLLCLVHYRADRKQWVAIQPGRFVKVGVPFNATGKTRGEAVHNFIAKRAQEQLSIDGDAFNPDAGMLKS